MAAQPHSSPWPTLVIGLVMVLLILGSAWLAWRALGDDREVEAGGSYGRQLLSRSRRKAAGRPRGHE